MKSSAIILATGLLLTGCALKGNDTGEPADEAINGETVYFEYCARCHEEGVFGAPRRGQLEDWKNRSQLWQAVLMEHAKEGYLDMPARGGLADLPDEVVNAAAEYLIEHTFCDWPCD
jgi:cytochrome c5